jgi:hypothetical protein
MDFRIRQARGTPGVDDMRLDVSQSGPITVTVAAGTFTLCGVEYEFAEYHDWTPVEMPSDDRRYVNGSIALSRDTGEPVFIVDEFVFGVSEDRYDWNSGPYEHKHLLFCFEIPAGAQNFDSVECNVEHIVPPPVEE